MSSNTASDTDSRTAIEATCGHRVPYDDVHHSGEFRYCEECFLELDREFFALDDYPEILKSRKHTAIEGRGSTTVVNHVALVATTQDRKALYHDERNDRFWYVVPMHSEFHNTDDAVEAPIREQHTDATRGAPPDFSRDSFCTIPNGDHLAVVSYEDAPHNIPRWINEHSDELREVRDRYEPTRYTPPMHD